MTADLPHAARPRESGDPALDSRLRGNERNEAIGEPTRRRLAGFARTLRDNGFRVGLAETRDALAILASPAALRPASLRPALRALFCATHSDWERFDEIFAAFWHGHGMRQRQVLVWRAGAKPAPARRLAEAQVPQEPSACPTGSSAAATATARRCRGRARPPRRRLARRSADERRIFATSSIPKRSRRRTRSPRAWPASMRARLVRREQVRRRGRRLDLRRTIHRSISHGGTPIDLAWRRRKIKPLRLVVLLDASGSMSLYTAFFVRFLHGVVDSFREAEAFVFHTRLAHVSPSLRDRDVTRAVDKLALDGARHRRRHAHRREPRDLQSLACAARHQFAHRRDDRLRRLRYRRAGAARRGDAAAAPPLPQDHLAQPADRLARLLAAGARHAGGAALCRSVCAGAQSRKPRRARAVSWRGSEP